MLCWEAGKPLVVEDLVLDAPKTGEVRVRIGAVAICHSDVHLIRGDWTGWSSTPPPVVAGHEAAGVVSEVGPGSRASVRATASSSRSSAPAAPVSPASPAPRTSARAVRPDDGAPAPRPHGQRSTPASASPASPKRWWWTVAALVVPADLGLDRACLLACGVITGVGAVLNAAQLTPGSSAVVIGAGARCERDPGRGARGGGAHRCRRRRRAEAAHRAGFGATHAVDGRDGDVRGLVRELTGGRAPTTLRDRGQPGGREPGAHPRPARGHRGPGGHAGGRGDGAGSDRGLRRQRAPAPRQQHGLDPARRGRPPPRRALPGRPPHLDDLITARYPLARINEAIVAMEAARRSGNVIVFPVVTRRERRPRRPPPDAHPARTSPLRSDRDRQLEQERLFARLWVLVGRLDQFPAVGHDLNGARRRGERPRGSRPRRPASAPSSTSAATAARVCARPSAGADAARSSAATTPGPTGSTAACWARRTSAATSVGSRRLRAASRSAGGLGRAGLAQPGRRAPAPLAAQLDPPIVQRFGSSARFDRYRIGDLTVGRTIELRGRRPTGS